MAVQAQAQVAVVVPFHSGNSGKRSGRVMVPVNLVGMPKAAAVTVTVVVAMSLWV
jgi:hypothetical protein